MKTTEITEININSLFEKIASVIEEARRRASTAINLSEVYAKFNVGRYIVEGFYVIRFGLFYDVNVLANLFALIVQTDSQTDFEICKYIGLVCIILISL